MKYEIFYYVSFYCNRCKAHISEVVSIEGDFDMFDAFNLVAERNVRGSGKAIGKCSYPGQGHIISGLSLTGIRRRQVQDDEEVEPLVK